MLSPIRNRRAHDDGASLLIAIVFVFAVGLWVVAIVQLAYPNLATSGVVSANRGSNYDADAALAEDIAIIRYSKADSSGYPYGSYGGSCPDLPYPANHPTVTVGCTVKHLVDSSGLTLPYQRYVQLHVCAGSSSTCTSPLATADVYYYDDGIWGRAAFVKDWSTR